MDNLGETGRVIVSVGYDQYEKDSGDFWPLSMPYSPTHLGEIIGFKCFHHVTVY